MEKKSHIRNIQYVRNFLLGHHIQQNVPAIQKVHMSLAKSSNPFPLYFPSIKNCLIRDVMGHIPAQFCQYLFMDILPINLSLSEHLNIISLPKAFCNYLHLIMLTGTGPKGLAREGKPRQIILLGLTMRSVSELPLDISTEVFRTHILDWTLNTAQPEEFMLQFKTYQNVTLLDETVSASQ